MTRVLAGAAGDRFFLQVCGHATGSVQVCAAVSGLVYALAGYVQNDACVKDNICDIMGADARLSFSGGEQAAGAFWCVVIGLEQIAKANPTFLEVRVTGRA